MGTGETRDKEVMFFGGDIPELKGLACAPELDAICFPQRNLSRGPVCNRLLLHSSEPTFNVATVTRSARERPTQEIPDFRRARIRSWSEPSWLRVPMRASRRLIQIYAEVANLFRGITIS